CFEICCCDRRDLHSFPTRRSSDLESQQREMNTFFILNAHWWILVMDRVSHQGISLLYKHVDMDVDSFSFFTLQLVNTPQYELYRSEEHTSELQSRENLVCRLLLEK